LFQAILLEVGVGIHSVILGFDFGGLGPDDRSTINVLIIALSFHQFFECFSLGAGVAEAKFGMMASSGLLSASVLTLPFGAMLGIFASSSSRTGVIAKSCADGFAAGMLIYMVLVEMISADFSMPKVLPDMKLQASMIVALVSGISGMALLAIWA
jgi:zinc transporter 1/2/3